MRMLALVIAALITNFVQSQSAWELKKDENNIKIFTRSISGSTFKEFKAEGLVSGSVNNVISILQDPDSYLEWIPDCEQAFLIKRPDKYSHIHYIESNAPWPVDNRDMIIEYKYSKINTASYHIDVKCRPELLVKKENIVRMEKLTGFWIISQLSENQVKITYQIHAEPNGKIPSSIANTFIVDSPYQTIIGIQKQLMRKF